MSWLKFLIVSILLCVADAATACPAGTYETHWGEHKWGEASFGGCVKRPDNDPTEATARCADGAYSHSEHREGACSGHGGIARQ